MQHPRGIANATRIHGHLDDLLLHGRRLTSRSIRQEKCAPVLWARTAPIPLLALPRHAMSHNIRALTVGAVQYLKTHESTLSHWSFSASHPRIKDSRSTPLEHLPTANVPDKTFQWLIRQFEERMIILSDTAFHATEGDPANLKLYQRGVRDTPDEPARAKLDTYHM
jgi:hypothetical protein